MGASVVYYRKPMITKRMGSAGWPSLHQQVENIDMVDAPEHLKHGVQV